jgi:hypothetical protein
MSMSLLAGGLGTRFQQESEYRPKLRIEVGQRPITWRISRFKPLPILAWLFSMVSLLGIAIISFRAFVFGVPFPGWGTLVCLNLLLFGFLFLGLSIVAEYVGMTFGEVRGRPAFIERSSRNAKHADRPIESHKN